MNLGRSVCSRGLFTGELAAGELAIFEEHAQPPAEDHAEGEDEE